MAIVGNVEKIRHLLRNRQELEPVFAYFTTMLTAGSPPREALLALTEPHFVRIDLVHGCFALEQVYVTKERSECFFESHRRYIDFQLLLCGEEMMELVDIDQLTLDRHDEDKDFIFYRPFDEAMKLVMRPGDLAIYFPDDAHMGLQLYKSSQRVHKTVVKVPVELLHGL